MKMIKEDIMKGFTAACLCSLLCLLPYSALYAIDYSGTYKVDFEGEEIALRLTQIAQGNASSKAKSLQDKKQSKITIKFRKPA